MARAILCHHINTNNTINYEYYSYCTSTLPVTLIVTLIRTEYGLYNYRTCCSLVILVLTLKRLYLLYKCTTNSYFVIIAWEPRGSYTYYISSSPYLSNSDLWPQSQVDFTVMNCRDADVNVFPHVHRDPVRGLAVPACEEQHQALRLGEKSEPPSSRTLPLCSVPKRCEVRPSPVVFVFVVQYVVVSSKKILFYNSEQDKELSNPYMVLDIEWVSAPPTAAHTLAGRSHRSPGFPARMYTVHTYRHVAYAAN